MSYEEALVAAGATVLVYQSFGSYQGDWWALVEYNGERGWVNGSYGSCSGCDAFEAEFGKGYLNCLYSHDEALRLASDNLEWDSGAQEMVDFINLHP